MLRPVLSGLYIRPNSDRVHTGHPCICSPYIISVDHGHCQGADKEAAISSGLLA